MLENLLDQFLDQNNQKLQQGGYYKVYPFSTPHILRGLNEDKTRAIFENFGKEQATLTKDEVADRVQIYTPEEFESLIQAGYCVAPTEASRLYEQLTNWFEKNREKKN